jgi:hypothetical protein
VPKIRPLKYLPIKRYSRFFKIFCLHVIFVDSAVVPKIRPLKRTIGIVHSHFSRIFPIDYPPPYWETREQSIKNTNCVNSHNLTLSGLGSDRLRFALKHSAEIRYRIGRNLSMAIGLRYCSTGRSLSRSLSRSTGRNTDRSLVSPFARIAK